LSILLSLLVPALLSKSPDCGGILTPAGLSYCKWGARICRVAHQAVLVSRHLHFCSTRNQIKSVEVVDLSLSLIPDTGLRLSMDVDLGVSPAPSSTKVMRLSIVADLQTEMNAEGNLELVTSACKPTIEEKQSTEEKQSIEEKQSTKEKQSTEESPNLPSLLPPLSEHPSAWFAAPFPVTPSCQVQYLPLAAPVFSKQGITISLQTTFQVSGMAIPLPVSPVPFSMPELASSSSSHLTLAFSEHYYTSFFFAMEMAGAFNMTILSPLVACPPCPEITPLPWQMGSLFQEDLPVVLQAVFRSSPWVVLEEGKAALKLFLTIQVGAVSPAFQSFLSINVDTSAGLLLSVANKKMKISAEAIEDIELSLAASDVGPVPAALLEELFLPTIRAEVPAQVNAVLSEGIFLPHIPAFTYTDVNVIIHKDYVLVPCNLQIQARIG
ncbi:TENP protein, partial [Halcyon senegalensis]|nr:TENP protein [Halcyon senegalensis]